MDFLVKKAKKKDKTAFVALMERQKIAMYKVAKSYLRSEEDVADAIQETILTCYEKLDSLEKEQYFKTWLIRILINKCKDIQKAGCREFLPGQMPEQGGTCMALENYEFYELLKALDEKYRTVLVLYYAEGFKVREIAQILELEENTVKTRLSRGRKQLAREYRGEPGGCVSEMAK
ncbi:MAG: sigma-70 family RNA polymerase sigma factor [Ruminococcus sp.]|nr:sigma-70 family RNA polymerase sigma factor [Ruminococcus sp.]